MVKRLIVDIVRGHRPLRDAFPDFMHRHPQLLAYLLIVAIALVGFWQVDRSNEQMCDFADDNRTAIRTTIEGVASLGEQLVRGPHLDKDVPLDPSRQEQLDRIAEFQRSQLELLDQPPCMD
jgi:hypothetical protein